MIYRNENGYFVVMDTMETYMMYYDTILWCLYQMLKKHKAEHANVMLAVAQVDVFAKTPTGMVLLHYNKDEIVDGFATALAVGGDIPWVEVVHLWLRTGASSYLIKEGFAFIEKYAWEHWKSQRFLISVMRSPKRLYEKFYKQLGFKPAGLILEREIKS